MCVLSSHPFWTPIYTFFLSMHTVFGRPSVEVTLRTPAGKVTSGVNTFFFFVCVCMIRVLKCLTKYEMGETLWVRLYLPCS